MFHNITLLPTFILTNVDVTVSHCNVNSRKHGTTTSSEFTIRMRLSARLEWTFGKAKHGAAQIRQPHYPPDVTSLFQTIENLQR
jgi:hypothetical protein